ncbi:MAG: nucleotidyltransferase family protein [Candidatus Brocadiales bacterium]|nr:nucleotidyltransferase family protein [Candidatus Brocadiales bacterium]
MQDEIALSSIKNKLRRLLPVISEQYQVKTLGIFGSYLHDKQHIDSDLDLLVSFIEPPGLLKLIELENYLSDILGIRVDLVMDDTLKPRIGKRILSEAVPL